MKTYMLRGKTDEVGRLRLEVQTDRADTEYELVVVVQEEQNPEIISESDIPPLGTAARLAYEAERSKIYAPGIVDASQTDAILRDEFADHLLRKPNNENVTNDALADSSFLFSLFNKVTQQHQDVLKAMQQIRGQLIVPVVCLTEVAFLFHRTGGITATTQFLTLFAGAQPPLESVSIRDLSAQKIL